MSSIGQNSTISEHGDVAQNIVMLHIELNGITKYSNMIAVILPADPPPPPPDLMVKKSKFDFSEHCHVAYQILLNHEI